MLEDTDFFKAGAGSMDVTRYMYCPLYCSLFNIHWFQFALAWGFSGPRLLHASSHMLMSELTVKVLNIM